jgi:DNA modification methylase
MYSNHARIVNSLQRLGLTQLPDILWRKPTNAPNKFMGSGTLPVGAYVTYEHEYILIFRRGERRLFNREEERRNRRQSAFFWEERNRWFSDIWEDLKGSAQSLADRAARRRSGAYPFELAYRLICMHSTYGDTVLDPFLGTGTTMAGAIASGRNSIGIEIDESLRQTIDVAIARAVAVGAARATSRLVEHRKFVDERLREGRTFKHCNKHYGFPVMTSQECDLQLFAPRRQTLSAAGTWDVTHEAAKMPAVTLTLF